MTEPRPLGVLRELAVVREYSELMRAISLRVNELDVPRERLDALAGLPDGYVGKLLAPVPVRSIGQSSLGPLLQALGLALIVVEDLSTYEKMAGRLRKRANKYTYATDGMLPHKKYKRRTLLRGNSEWGSVMNSRAMLKMTPGDLRRRAKIAAKARWRRINAEKA